MNLCGFSDLGLSGLSGLSKLGEFCLTGPFQNLGPLRKKDFVWENAFNPPGAPVFFGAGNQQVSWGRKRTTLHSGDTFLGSRAYFADGARIFSVKEAARLCFKNWGTTPHVQICGVEAPGFSAP